MKKRILLAGLFAVSALITACSDDEVTVQAVPDNQPVVSNPEKTPETQGKQIVLHGVANGDEQIQKTMLGSDGKSVLFTDGDKISLFDGNGKNCPMTSKISDGGKSADFTGTITTDAADYYILYPYQENAGFSSAENKITAELPANQTATSNSFDPAANLSAAICKDGGNFSLRNIGSLLKFTTNEAFSKIVVKSLNGEKIAGKCTISFDADGIPEAVPASDAVSEITLVPSGNGDIAAGTYYVALLPGTLANGLTIEFYRNDTKVTDTGDRYQKSLGFARCGGKNCGRVVTIGGEYILKSEYLKMVDVDAAGNVSNPFSIGECEVTQALWYAVMGENPSKFKEKNPDNTDNNYSTLPVETVSWCDICDEDGFLDRLNKITGKNFRLPTSDEWILAAQGGKPDYSLERPSCTYYWYKSTSEGVTHPVAYDCNRLGIYDMSGNVSEWCADGYGDYYYTRGGAWAYERADCQIGGYILKYPDNAQEYTGFRLAHSL